MKVLLIDDNKEITDILSRIMKLNGIDITVLNDSTDSLNLIKKEKFDAIVLDLAMPQISGYDILESLSNDGLIKQNKIIVLTAVALAEKDITQLKNIGVALCLLKPIRSDQLIESIKSIVS